MKQDVGFFDVGTDQPDLVIENGDLKAENGLEMAALISAFSDRRVEIQDLPPGVTDQKGWWADAISEPITDLIGSKLWTTLRTGKVTDQIIAELTTIMDEAFQWMIEDGIAASVSSSSERLERDRAQVTVVITKPSGDNIPFKFVWDGQALKLVGSTT